MLQHTFIDALAHRSALNKVADDATRGNSDWTPIGDNINHNQDREPHTDGFTGRWAPSRAYTPFGTTPVDSQGHINEPGLPHGPTASSLTIDQSTGSPQSGPGASPTSGPTSSMTQPAANTYNPGSTPAGTSSVQPVQAKQSSFLDELAFRTSCEKVAKKLLSQQLPQGRVSNPDSNLAKVGAWVPGMQDFSAYNLQAEGLLHPWTGQTMGSYEHQVESNPLRAGEYAQLGELEALKHRDPVALSQAQQAMESPGQSMLYEQMHHFQQGLDPNKPVAPPPPPPQPAHQQAPAPAAGGSAPPAAPPAAPPGSPPPSPAPAQPQQPMVTTSNEPQAPVPAHPPQMPQQQQGQQKKALLARLSRGSSLDRLVAAQIEKKAFLGMGMVAPNIPLGMMPGFPGMGPPMPIFPGMFMTHPGMLPAFLGNPPQTEPSLKDNYEREREKIINLAGQSDPRSGQPYRMAEVDRRMNSLNATVNKALQHLRRAHKAYDKSASLLRLVKEVHEKKAEHEKKAWPMYGYGGGYGMQYSPHPFTGLGVPMHAYGYPGQSYNHAMNANPYYGFRPGVGQAGFGMPGLGMGGYSPFAPSAGYHNPFMGGYGGYGSPMFGNISPVQSGANVQGNYELGGGKANLEEERERLRGLQAEANQAQNRMLTGEAGQVTKDDLENAFKELAAKSRLTSQEGGGEHGSVIDPVTGRSRSYSFGNRELLGSGQWWNSGAWRDYQDALERYNQLAKQFGTWKGNKQQQQESQLAPLMRQSEGNVSRLQQEMNSERTQELANRRRMRSQMQNRMMNPMGGMGSMLPPMPQPAMSAPASPPVPHLNPPSPTPAPHVGGPAPEHLGAPKPSPGLGDQVKMSSLDKLAHAVALSKVGHVPGAAAKSLASHLKTLGLLTGGGALVGGLTGAATAPTDYMPEAVGRGALLGAAAGAGTFGGGLVGKGLGHAAGQVMGRPAIYRGLGTMAGGAAGGTAALMAGHVHSNPTPWEQGDIPLLERIEEKTRRRNLAPDFHEPRRADAPSLKLAAAVLKDMGL